MFCREHHEAWPLEIFEEDASKVSSNKHTLTLTEVVWKHMFWRLQWHLKSCRICNPSSSWCFAPKIKQQHIFQHNPRGHPRPVWFRGFFGHDQRKENLLSDFHKHRLALPLGFVHPSLAFLWDNWRKLLLKTSISKGVSDLECRKGYNITNINNWNSQHKGSQISHLLKEFFAGRNNHCFPKGFQEQKYVNHCN